MTDEDSFATLRAPNKTQSTGVTHNFVYGNIIYAIDVY